jgi:hypothetical protein
VLLDEVGVRLAGERQRQHEQIVRGVSPVDHAAVDLPEMVRALGRREQRLDTVDRARVTLARLGGGEGRQVELGDVRELPPGLALEAGDVELGGTARRVAAALLQPLGLPDSSQLSQWNPPSGAR